jgi:glycosyltransferase involved in cell wall biosynthesis
MDRGKWSGLYDLRLKVSIDSRVIRIPESLSTRIEPAGPTGDLGLFDYLRPENREIQADMERVASSHLRRIGAFLEPRFENITKETRPVTASVIIPVKDRENTIGEAVESALAQETDFNYTVIVVDNHSTDRTSSILEGYARKDHRLIHLVPTGRGLLIGECWNEAIRSTHCGTYAVQLDSDDLYADKTALQKMVGWFNHGDYAMVVGAYRTTDFQLKEIPPGVVDHREWTRENGRNNLLRVNGVGAPRAYYSPLLRSHPFPNVSYGEDYAVALCLSRRYEIGRIFDPLYICRRWHGNTDTCLSIEASNRNDAYKDGLRTVEILERQKLNGEEG